MAHPTHAQQYVLLPLKGMTATRADGSGHVGNFLQRLDSFHRPHAATPPLVSHIKDLPMRVLDSIHENGVKLIEMPPDCVPRLRAKQPGLRIVPVVYYRTADCTYPVLATKIKPGNVRRQRTLTITVVDRETGEPLGGATVVGFTDYAAREGAEAETKANGTATLTFERSTASLERLYVLRDPGYWGTLKKRVRLTSTLQVRLLPIDMADPDALRHYYGSIKDTDGAKVKVAIVDSGIAPHRDLRIDGGVNTVTGEQATDHGDNGIGHGTHVAGIVAGRGLPPNGIRGIAPGVILRSYRVFGQDSEEAASFAIAKAIDRAVADQCDLINLSLGGGPSDETVLDAIEDARTRGTVVLAATGNDGRQQVSFPASSQLALAVSAFGRKGLYPPDAPQREEALKPPHGNDPEEFIARFSNIGTEVDFSGPGVGIVSTYPGGYAAWNGTSMACPAVTGAGANLLAKRPDILRMGRMQDRSDAIAQLLYQAAKSMQFGERFEGRGRVVL